jgi:hypothetical protein
MLLYTLQATGAECIDCAEHGLNGDWKSAIACFVTLGITAIIRHIEKKRIEKNNKKNS